MPPEIIALIEKPYLLVAVLFVGGLVGMTIEQFASSQRRQAWRARSCSRAQKTLWFSKPASDTPKRLDAAEQLRIVMSAAFERRRLLNVSEARVFKELGRIVIGWNPTWQVMAQVSLGEILRSGDAEAYRCINSKRVDLLLVDADYQPRHAIEYQGGAHHQGTAAARDAVKKEALRRAGIGYHEVVAGQTTPADLRRLVGKLVGQPTAPNGSSPRAGPGQSPTRQMCPEPAPHAASDASLTIGPTASD